MRKAGFMGLFVMVLFHGTTLSQNTGKFKLIVNAQNPISAMAKDQIEITFLKKATSWENGLKTAPIDLPYSSPIRQFFSRVVLGKDISAVKAFWQIQIFSGRDVPPLQKKTEEEIIQYVENNQGAIGYVPAKTRINNRGVKEIKIL